MNSGLTYTYEELVTKAEGIRNFTATFSTQLGNLLDAASEISQNYQSEESTKVVNAINKVEEDGEEFKEAIRKFADVISEDIAPTYQAIERETSEAVSDIYS